MKGELGYKDIHGRFWRCRERSTFQWLGETLDVGHTTNPNRAASSIERLLDDIDRDEYQINTAEPLDPLELLDLSKCPGCKSNAIAPGMNTCYECSNNEQLPEATEVVADDK